MHLTERDVEPETAVSLVERIATGDASAETELVEKYWRSMLFILKRQTQDDELARDIAQDTFIIVIEKARSNLIDNPQSIAAFIRQVGTNLLIANFRKESRRKTDAADDIQIRFPDNSHDLQKKLEGAQLTEIVKQVIEELPTARDRDLLHRFFIYGQSKKQICLDLELTAAHFDRVLYRARNRLKQILQVKLGINANNISLSQLLVLALVTSMQYPMYYQPHHQQFFSPSVRDLEAVCHFQDINVKERRSDKLESSQYQPTTRCL